MLLKLLMGWRLLHSLTLEATAALEVDREPPQGATAEI